MGRGPPVSRDEGSDRGEPPTHERYQRRDNTIFAWPTTDCHSQANTSPGGVIVVKGNIAGVHPVAVARPPPCSAGRAPRHLDAGCPGAAVRPLTDDRNVPAAHRPFRTGAARFPETCAPAAGGVCVRPWENAAPATCRSPRVAGTVKSGDTNNFFLTFHYLRELFFFFPLSPRVRMYMWFTRSVFFSETEKKKWCAPDRRT